MNKFTTPVALAQVPSWSRAQEAETTRPPPLDREPRTALDVERQCGEAQKVEKRSLSDTHGVYVHSQLAMAQPEFDADATMLIDHVPRWDIL